MEITRADEAQARKLVSEGKLRAAIVFRSGLILLRPRCSPRRPTRITLIEDPSKAMEVSLVQGLMTQHIMQAVAAQAFSPTTLSADTIASWRKGLADSGSGVSPDQQSALGGLFDSLERLRIDQQKGATATANRFNDGSNARYRCHACDGGGMRQPFSVDKQSAVGTRDSQYNGYAHSFAGMSVQFILFLPQH